MLTFRPIIIQYLRVWLIVGMLRTCCKRTSPSELCFVQRRTKRWRSSLPFRSSSMFPLFSPFSTKCAGIIMLEESKKNLKQGFRETMSAKIALFPC